MNTFKPGPPTKGETRTCHWIGYGFGAHYPDAHCVEGRASDADDCWEEDGEVKVAQGDEPCPQCKGTGIIDSNTKLLGKMALMRQRGKLELDELIDEISDKNVASEIRERVHATFRLIDDLESEHVTS